MKYRWRLRCALSALCLLMLIAAQGLAEDMSPQASLHNEIRGERSPIPSITNATAKPVETMVPMTVKGMTMTQSEVSAQDEEENPAPDSVQAAGHGEQATAPASDEAGDGSQADQRMGSSRGMNIPTMLPLAALLIIAICAVWLLRRRIRNHARPESVESGASSDTPPTDMKRKQTRLLIQAAVINDKGRVRANNEDNFLLNGAFMPKEEMDAGGELLQQCDDDFQLYAVCDGVGGIDAGEEASFAAVSALARYREETPQSDSPTDITQALRGISDDICLMSQEKGLHSGTTLALMIFHGARADIINVGDSRVYRLRDGTLTQRSVDHSEAQRMIELGVITKSEAKAYPRKHVITQYLGMSPDAQLAPQVTRNVALRSGDIFLLCSDGLTDMVDDARIQEILTENAAPASAVRALVQTALDCGGRDNVTVMVLRVDAAGAGK